MALLIVAYIPNLGTGKLIVYQGPILVAPGSKALYVTRHMYTCADPLRVQYPLSLLSLNLAVVTRYPTTLTYVS